MDVVKIDAPGVSPMEMVMLAILLVLCVAVGWAMYRKWSGRTTSDVSGLRLGQHRDATRPS
jgi:hypothetical protein